MLPSLSLLIPCRPMSENRELSEGSRSSDVALSCCWWVAGVVACSRVEAITFYFNWTKSSWCFYRNVKGGSKTVREKRWSAHGKKSYGQISNLAKKFQKIFEKPQFSRSRPRPSEKLSPDSDSPTPKTPRSTLSTLVWLGVRKLFGKNPSSKLIREAEYVFQIRTGKSECVLQGHTGKEL